MSRRTVWRGLCRASSIAFLACSSLAIGADRGPLASAKLNAHALVTSPVVRADWPLTGGSPAAQNFSSLAQINEDNIKALSLVGYYDIPTQYGQEATPLAVDGVLYFSTDWSIVKAVDGRTGKLLWSFDPRARAALVDACCGPVSRGVAYFRGKIFVGALDGRLIALEARTGKEIWEVQTTDRHLPYTVTGAPIVADGKVIIGNGGADMGAVRGYVTAYGADTGRFAWRFYTVPGPPGRLDHAASDGALKRLAAPTWHGQYWRFGGGGTVWNAMSYDPRLDELYLGTGNGTPWNAGLRSQGRGDNLFSCAIVALQAATGRYVWHYQTTPGDAWDFDADEQMALASLRIGGRVEQVLMQASKNGYFYVLDRTTGRVISAQAYVPMTWSSGVDLKTGRPIVTPHARYYDTKSEGFLVIPSGFGAHSWQAMAFSPATGLAYFPAQQLPLVYRADETDGNFGPLKENLGARLSLDQSPHTAGVEGWLIAWNPVTAKAVWRVKEPGPWNGGVLATGGGLVFQGDATGALNAYSAGSGRRLWRFKPRAVSLPRRSRTQSPAKSTSLCWLGGVVVRS